MGLEQCCCRWGAAVGKRFGVPSAETPEFPCPGCPKHAGESVGDADLCERHRLARVRRGEVCEARDCQCGCHLHTKGARHCHDGRKCRDVKCTCNKRRKPLTGAQLQNLFPAVSTRRGGIKYETPTPSERPTTMSKHRKHCKYTGEPFADVSVLDPSCSCTVTMGRLEQFVAAGCLCHEQPCDHYDAEALRTVREGRLSRAQLEDSLQSVRRELDECRRETRRRNPREPENGGVVRFRVLFEMRGDGRNRTYTYVAAKIANLWYVTGKGFGSFEGGRGGSWTQLCDAIRAHDVGIDAYQNGDLILEVLAGEWVKL